MIHSRGFGAIVLAGGLSLVLTASSGCSYHTSSLKIAGEESSRGGLFGREQWVHVGEPVKVIYDVRSGWADYAILHISPLDRSEVALATEPGSFRFRDLRFEQPTPPEKPMRLRAWAYRERGQRDYMDLDGELLSRESPYDVPDSRVASASMKIHVYQTSLSIPIPPDPAGYNWQTAKLLLYADPARPVEVRPVREYRTGFRIEGPTAAGGYVMAYEPTAEQVRRTGSTRVVFTVSNTAGFPWRYEDWLETP